MEYKDWTISDCIKKVNDSLFLPDIQRPYVWSEDDIYLLFDSICRDYPINTVLFWFLEKNTLEEVAFIKRIKFLDQRFDENYPDTGALTRDHYFLAIDGQQRITSLFLTLKGTYKIKQRRNVINADLYFNFLSGVEENDKEILYEFQFFPQSKPDVWVETIEDKKKQRPSYSKNWIRVKYIYSLGVLHEVQTKVKEKIRQQIGVDISDPAFGSIFKLWSKLNFDKMITYYEEKTQDYDKVLDIFIRTNSGGQKLSYSDLLFSFIKSRWNEARDKFNDLLKQLNEGTKFKYTHDVLLKSILFIHAHDQEGLKYRTSNFTDKILNDTELEWDSKIVTAIKLTKDLLSSRFMLTHDKLITSYNAIVPITYYIYKYDLKGIGEEPNKITSELQSQIRQWLITSMLTGVFGGQSDGILHRAKKAIDENGGPGYFPVRELFEKFNDFKPSLNLAITKDLVRSFSYNSTESYLILSLLYNNSVNFNPLTDENLPQQDHIISQSELKRARISKEKINSIYNIRYVTASDNRMKSDESFVDWSSRLGNHVLQNHFIPEGTWNSENFDEFLAKREALFLNQLVINV